MRPVNYAFYLAGLLSPLPAFAQASGPPPVGPSSDVLDPFTILAPPLNGPRLGEGDDDWTMRYTGYLAGAQHGSLGYKWDANTGHVTHPFHIPALIPDNLYGTWTSTGVQPSSWAHFSLMLGTSLIETGMTAGAWTHAPQSQAPGQSQWAEGVMAFTPWVTVRTNDLYGSKIRADMTIGGAGGGYGQAGKYDSGPYGTTAVGNVGAFGVRAAVEKDFGDITLRLEYGLGANGYPGNATLATSVVNHGHIITRYQNDKIRTGVHYYSVVAQDDRVITGKEPDGSIKAFGADLRLGNLPFGDFFIGGGHVILDHVMHIGGGFSTVNVGDGQGFMNNFLGTDTTIKDAGTGTLTNLMAQYEFSSGALERYPGAFWGDGPDLHIRVFGVGTKVRSVDPLWNKKLKIKGGADAVYSFSPYMAVGLRYDRVMPDMDDQVQNFNIITPSILLRSGYNAHEKITINYSRYIYGKKADGSIPGPQMPNPTILQANQTGDPMHLYDENVFGIMGSMWF
jgi:hypothetical protein